MTAPGSTRQCSISVAMGALAAPLHEQLDCEPALLEGSQWQADCVARLHIAGILTDAETHRARSRIVKNIGRLLSRRAP